MHYEQTGNMETEKVTGVSNVDLGSYDYMDMKKSLKKGERRTLQLRPISGDNNFAYNSNQVIMFDIPFLEGAFMDLKNTTLQFTGKGGTPLVPSTQIGINNLVESVINRFALYLADGTNEIEVVNYYNIKANALLKYKISDDYYNTIALQQWGVADEATRLQWASNGRDYAVNLIASGFFSSPMVYIPLNLMAKANNYSRSMRLEITLEDPNVCMFSTDPNALKNYFLSNVFMQIDYIEMKEYGQELKNKINNGSLKLTIPFSTSHTWPSTLLQGTQGRQSISFQEYKQYMTGIMTVFTQTTDNTQEYTNKFVYPNLTAYQYQINNQYYPIKEILLRPGNGVSPSYAELIKYFNKTKMYSESTTGASMNNGSPFYVYSNNHNIIGNTVLLATPYDALSNLVSIVQPSSLFDLDKTTGLFTVNQSGFYNINASVIGVCYNSLPGVSNVQFTIQLMSVLGAFYTSLPSPFLAQTTVPVTNSGLIPGSPTQDLCLSGNVYLKTGVTYSLALYMLPTSANGVTDKVEILDIKFSASLLSASPAGDSVDFILGQTLRTFFDHEEHLNNINEYLLDGKEVRMSSVINLNIGTPLAYQTQMYNFVDYTGAVVIDKEKVIVIA
jgi:hypothetical protein